MWFHFAIFMTVNKGGKVNIGPTLCLCALHFPLHIHTPFPCPSNSLGAWQYPLLCGLPHRSSWYVNLLCNWFTKICICDIDCTSDIQRCKKYHRMAVTNQLSCIGLLPNSHVMLALGNSSAPLVLKPVAIYHILTSYWFWKHVRCFPLMYRRQFSVWVQVDHVKGTPHHLYAPSSRTGILILLHSKRWTASRNSFFVHDFAYIYKFCYHDQKVTSPSSTESKHTWNFTGKISWFYIYCLQRVHRGYGKRLKEKIFFDFFLLHKICLSKKALHKVDRYLVIFYLNKYIPDI